MRAVALVAVKKIVRQNCVRVALVRLARINCEHDGTTHRKAFGSRVCQLVSYRPLANLLAIWGPAIKTRTTGSLQAQKCVFQGSSAAIALGKQLALVTPLVQKRVHAAIATGLACSRSSSMNALVESLLAPAPEVDPEDATNFDDGTAARTSTGFKAGEDLAVIPKRRLVDDGEAPVGLAKSSRAELFDDGLDSGDDDVVPEDDDDIDEAIYGDDDDESDDSDEPSKRPGR